jgi:hypothetical protein
MSEENIDYQPIPTIEAFHRSSAPIRCIVGPVGSAKTTGATMEIFHYLPLYLARKHKIKKTRWLILRNSYRELKDTTQKTVFEWIPWGDYRASDEKYTVKYPQGIEIEAIFRSCDRPEDIKKFKSLEITGYWIDESIEVKEDIKLMLKNRIGRYPKKSPVRYGIETTNPPDIEHPTYYNFNWQTHVPGPVADRKEAWQQVLEEHIGFWQPSAENAVNLRDGYYTDLIRDYAGNPDWIARYVRGEPGMTVAGKPVYHNFRKQLHVGETPFTWTGQNLFVGWDNTGNCPACVICQVPTAGIVQVLAEYHTERMGIVDFVNMVILDRNSRYPDATYTEWGDPAGEARFSRRGGGLTSNEELMKEEAGIALKRSEQNWEARRESVETQLGRMVAGEPALMIDPGCIRLINGFLGGYAYPEVGTSGEYGIKPVKNKYSHVHDALQYVMVMLTKQVTRERRTRKHKAVGFSNWLNKDRRKDDGRYREYYVP